MVCAPCTDIDCVGGVCARQQGAVGGVHWLGVPQLFVVGGVLNICVLCFILCMQYMYFEYVYVVCVYCMFVVCVCVCSVTGVCSVVCCV